MAAEPTQPSQLHVVEPQAEPIVLVIGGTTTITRPDDPAWPIAHHAREVEQHLQRAERDLRGKRALIAQLRNRNKDEAEKERKAHPQRTEIEQVIEHWRTRSGHKRAKSTPERFDMVAARITEDYGLVDLLMAIEGLFSPPVVIKGQLHDDLKVAMRSGTQVERYANKCPAAVRQQLRGTLFA